MKLIQFNNEPLLVNTNKEPKSSEETIEIYSKYLKRNVFNYGLITGFIVGVVITLLACYTYFNHMI